jgi:hypothetical protein
MRFGAMIVLAAAVAALGAAAATLGPAPADAQAACGAVLKWRGVFYFGDFPTRGIKFGARVGTGQIPDCADTGEPPGPSTPITLLRVAGVRPAIAVGTAPDRELYLRHGFVIQSPHHPLHEKIFRGRSPNETRGWSCGREFRRAGRVASAPPLVVRIRYRGTRRQPQLFVDARTRFSDRLTRFGVPFLGIGARVTVVATRCTASGGRSKVVVRFFGAVAETTLAGRGKPRP